MSLPWGEVPDVAAVVWSGYYRFRVRGVVVSYSVDHLLAYCRCVGGGLFM
jgi:hypothetical protein